MLKKWWIEVKQWNPVQRKECKKEGITVSTAFSDTNRSLIRVQMRTEGAAVPEYGVASGGRTRTKSAASRFFPTLAEEKRKNSEVRDVLKRRKAHSS